MTLHRGGPRVIYRDGFKVLHGDLADMTSLQYREQYDEIFARLFGGAYGAMRDDSLQFRSVTEQAPLTQETDSRPWGRFGPNDLVLVADNPASTDVRITGGSALLYDDTGVGDEDARFTILRLDADTVLTIPTQVTGNGHARMISIKTDWTDTESETRNYKEITTGNVTEHSVFTQREPQILVDVSSTSVDVTAAGSWAVAYAALQALVPSGYTELGVVYVPTGAGNLGAEEVFTTMPALRLAPGIGGNDARPASPLHHGPYSQASPWVHEPTPTEGIVYGFNRESVSGLITRYIGFAQDSTLVNPTWTLVDDTIDWRNRIIWALGIAVDDGNDVRPDQANEQFNVNGFGALKNGNLESEYMIWNFGVGGYGGDGAAPLGAYFTIEDVAGADEFYLAVSDGTPGTAGALYMVVAKGAGIAATGYINMVIQTMPAISSGM